MRAKSMSGSRPGAYIVGRNRFWSRNLRNSQYETPSVRRKEKKKVVGVEKRVQEDDEGWYKVESRRTIQVTKIKEEKRMRRRAFAYRRFLDLVWDDEVNCVYGWATIPFIKTSVGAQVVSIPDTVRWCDRIPEGALFARRTVKGEKWVFVCIETNPGPPGRAGKWQSSAVNKLRNAPLVKQTLNSLETVQHQAGNGEPALKKMFGKPTRMEAAIAGRVLGGDSREIADGDAGKAALAAEYADEGIRSGMNPTNKNYERMVQIAGTPLSYDKYRVSGHKEASTVRSIFHAKVIPSLLPDATRVVILAPSRAEMHLVPAAAFIWVRGVDVFDGNRLEGSCGCGRDCHVFAKAMQERRVMIASTLEASAPFCKALEIAHVLLTNIEPNLRADDLVNWMQLAGIRHGFSMITFAWQNVFNKTRIDTLIHMTHEVEGDNVISGFNETGDYVTPLENLKKLIAPTYSRTGAVLRRTMIFEAETSFAVEIQLSDAGARRATRFAPGMESFYFLRVPTITDVQRIVIVEKKAFDKVLATFAAAARHDMATARVILRQSAITYTLSGLALSPKVILSETEANDLAAFMSAFQTIQKAVNEKLVAPAQTVVAGDWKAAIVGKVTTAVGMSDDPLGALGYAKACVNWFYTDARVRTLEELSEEVKALYVGTRMVSITTFESQLARALGSSSLDTIASRMSTNKLPFVQAIQKLMMQAGKKLSLIYKMTMSLAENWNVTIKCTLAVMISLARMAGRMDWATRLTVLQSYTTWKRNKVGALADEVFTAVKKNPIEGAVMMVERYYEIFDVAPAVEDLEGVMPDLPVEDLAYQGFLSEFKLLMLKFRGAANSKRFAMKVVDEFRHRLVLDEKREELTRVVVTAAMREAVEEEMKQPVRPAVLPQIVSDLKGSLGEEFEFVLVPLDPVETVGGRMVDGREAVRSGVEVRVTENITLKALQSYEPNQFAEVDEVTRRLAPGFLDGGIEDAATTSRRMIPLAPNPEVHTKILAAVVAMYPHSEPMTEPPVAEVEIMAARLRGTDFDAYAAQVLAVSDEESGRHVLHVSGLPFSAKSKTISELLDERDLIVVPSRKLKRDWKKTYANRPVNRRPAIETQHKALGQQARRFVVVDEVYTFSQVHLQLLAKCGPTLITLGDPSQIGAVFDEMGGLMQARPEETARLKFFMAVSFCPRDALLSYLTTARDFSGFTGTVYYGVDHCDSLYYAVSDALVDTDDLVVVGTQAEKAWIQGLGHEAVNTSHESQGSRSTITVVYSDRVGYTFLEANKQHAGVTITRAKTATVLIVRQGALARWIPHCAQADINGLKVWTNTDAYIGHTGTLCDLADDMFTIPSLKIEIEEAEVMEMTGAGKKIPAYGAVPGSGKTYRADRNKLFIDADSTLGEEWKDAGFQKRHPPGSEQRSKYIRDRPYRPEYEGRILLTWGKETTPDWAEFKGQIDMAVRTHVFRAELVAPVVRFTEAGYDEAVAVALSEEEEPVDLGSARNGEAEISLDDHGVTRVSIETQDKNTSLETETVFENRVIPGAAIAELLKRTSEKIPPIDKGVRTAAKCLVERLFDQVFDKKTFDEVAAMCEDVGAIDGKTTHQVKAALATKFPESRPAVRAYAHGKPELAKKTFKAPDPAKLQGIIANSQIQQLVFTRAIKILTYAMVLSTKGNILLDIGITDQELLTFLSAINTVKGVKHEIDLERQDSSHEPVHVAVFSEFLRRSGASEEIVVMFEEIRRRTEIAEIKGELQLESGPSLGSGAPWTLIANILHMLTCLVNFYYIPKTTYAAQKGDDFTASGKLLAVEPIIEMPKVVMKHEFTKVCQFTSKSAVDSLAIRKSIRLLINAATSRRTHEQHDGYRAQIASLQREVELVGRYNYAEIREAIFGTGSEMWLNKFERAIHFSRLPFHKLPDRLKAEDAKGSNKLVSTSDFCAYHAVTACLQDPRKVVEAAAQLMRANVSKGEILTVCNDLGVPCFISSGRWSDVGAAFGANLDPKTHGVYVFDDHAVAVVDSSCLAPWAEKEFSGDDF